MTDNIKVETISINASLKKKLEDLLPVLQSISYFEVAKEKDGIAVAHVEAKDINKRPYLFYIITFKEKKIIVDYTLPSNINPIRRKLDIIKSLLNVLDLVSDFYKISSSTIFNLIGSVVDDCLKMTSQDYNKLYTKYEHIKKENSDLKKRLESLKESNDKLAKENYNLKNKYDDALIKIKKLEEMPEEALKAKLQEWIVEHNGSIDVIEFSNLYNVPERRVELALQELVKEGYLVPKE